MIYYFSGTGNSKWIADKMADLTEDKAVSITMDFSVIKEESEKGRKDLLGLIFPIYAWEVAPIMKSFIEDFLLKEKRAEDVYYYGIATCGSEAGLAFEKMEKYFPLDGKFSIVMPDNYIMMFNTEDEDKITKKLKEAKLTTEIIANHVNAKRKKSVVSQGTMGILKTYLTPPVFQLTVRDKAFYAEESCLDCGICVSKCPVGNIEMVDKKPRWKGNCIHCTACINYCPTEAIQYGKRTINRGRYNLEKALEDLDV